MNAVKTETVLWDVKDVARTLKVSRKTVYRKSVSGEIPCMRLFGTRLRFDPTVINALALGKKAAR